MMKHICEPLFRLNFLFTDAIDVEQYKKDFHKWNGIETECSGDLGGRFEGLTTVDGIERGIIWAPNSDPDIVAHEVMHAVQWGLEVRRDTPLCDATAELYAYYHQYLTKEILSNAIEKRIKVRKDLPNESKAPKKQRRTKKKS